MTAFFITATGTDIGKTFVTTGFDPAHARDWPPGGGDQAGRQRI